MEQFVRQGHENVTFFVGPEIEQTPAFGKKTLFVVGLQDLETIVSHATEHKIHHIFLSANRSFDSVDKVDGVYMVGDTLAADWDKQIHILLSMGYMVSLDYPAHKHHMVLEIIRKETWASRNFVPVLSVQIPHVSTSSNNLTIKIDDINFKATNPGVWCFNHHELTDNNRFTSWGEYGDDLVIRSSVIVDPGPTASLQIPVSTSSSTTTTDIDGDSDTTKTESPVLNNTELGLDTTPKNPQENKTEEVITTPTEAAEAYAGSEENKSKAKKAKR